MSEPKTQNFQNHTKLDPPFHFFMMPVALATVVMAIYQLTQRQTFATVWFVVVSLAVLVAFAKTRINPLKVQDRIIRLEERMRLSLVLPEPLRYRISELTVGQLVALRFAPDDELPALVEKTLAGGLKPKEIKQSIVNWRADDFRV